MSIDKLYHLPVHTGREFGYRYGGLTITHYNPYKSRESTRMVVYTDDTAKTQAERGGGKEGNGGNARGGG